MIETPKGSRNKFAYDPELGCVHAEQHPGRGHGVPVRLRLYSADQRTKTAIRLDVLLLMDVPAFTGCVVESRIVGVIQAEQTDEDGKPFATTACWPSPPFAHPRRHQRAEGPEQQMIKKLEDFFVAYNKARGTKFKLLGVKDAKVAMKLIKKDANEVMSLLRRTTPVNCSERNAASGGQCPFCPDKSDLWTRIKGCYRRYKNNGFPWLVPPSYADLWV